MLIDDTNYWKTEEKMFRELMPSDGLISTAEEACEVITAILSKKVSKKRKHWLLMFALTDRQLMRPDPKRVFECVMESKALSYEDKAVLCESAMKEKRPFKPEYVLSSTQLKARDEKIKTKVIKGFEELRQKTYNELMGEDFRGLDELLTHALGLPEVTIETYSLPYFRLFPTILPRYAHRVVMQSTNVGKNIHRISCYTGIVHSLHEVRVLEFSDFVPESWRDSLRDSVEMHLRNLSELWKDYA